MFIMGFLQDFISDTLNRILNSIGVASLGLSAVGNLSAWLTHVNWNGFFLVTSSILGIVYLVMKIYDQILITIKRRKEMHRKKLF